MSETSKKRLHWLCVCAMLVALEIVLNRFCSINTAGLKIGFSFVPPMLAAMLYGPATSALVYALSDFLGALLFPIGPYHPGFTVCAAGMGLLFGLLLYREKITFVHIIVPVICNCLVLGLVVNTLWVSQLYGSKTYWGWFLYRLPEYAVLIPVQILLAPVLKRLSGILRKSGLAGNAVIGRGVKS
ncbi:MAG: folate family ECF transporter S component [Clostridia bacterium]|nr:folate family ECF transporter S component [Clostridia bacterium]